MFATLSLVRPTEGPPESSTAQHLYHLYLFGMFIITLPLHNRQVWSSRGVYFGKTPWRQDTLRQTKGACYAPKVYQSGVISLIQTKLSTGEMFCLYSTKVD